MTEFWKNLSLENLQTEFEGVVYNEEWVDIKTHENLYHVSTFGRIKSLKRLVISRGGEANTEIKEKILVQKPSPRGYLVVGLNKEGKRSWFTVHRIVAKHFLLNLQNLPEVNHKNTVKTNNAKWNLEWISHVNNIIHAQDAGVFDFKGEKNKKAKLTERQVLEIREKRILGVQTRIMCAEYGVNRHTISAIFSRRSWTHI